MKYLSFVCFLCIAAQSFAQPLSVINHQATQFQLKAPHDTIDFIVFDTVLSEKKPVFLFCQGSLPVPLFFDIQGKIYMSGGGVSNFDVREIQKHYHLVVISMPKTPVIVQEKNLNNQYCFVPDTSKPDVFLKEYVEADFLQNYVDRANRVLKFLRKQPWVNNQKLIVAGHSQGSKVATKIAVSNKKVTHLGLFAANPFGRVDQFVRQARKDAETGKISWEEADRQMEGQYDYFKLANKPDSLARHPELKAWKTFSEPFLDDWLSLSIPIYLAYGTADRTSDLDDIVPLFFIQEHKNNLTIKRYLKMEHNFFEVDETGRAHYEKGHWVEVMRAFVGWTAER